MSRADLLALTPQAVASLSNLGLVKRAQRELGEGKGPSLEELADGTVVGTFPDGAVARLPVGKGLRDSPCSCGASGVCRHRVAVALAYPQFARSEATAGPGATAEEVRGTGGPAWSPGELTEAQLSAQLPPRLLEAARTFRRQGFLARIHRGAGGEDTPSVSLATCTVRFLVPRELGYARCDCTVGTLCDHLPLAVWAFREADRHSPAIDDGWVEVAGVEEKAAHGRQALEAAEEVARFVLWEGVEHLAQGAGARFALAREPVARASMLWLLDATEALEALLEAHRRRTALYSAGALFLALAELFARVRAGAASGGGVPARAVLGMDEAPETRLDHLRLVSLGARVLAEGRDRSVEVLLVDPASASLLVLRRAFTFPEGESPDSGPSLARRAAAPGATLETLARGQAVTSGATRRPNRLVVLTQRGLQRTSVTPQSGDWTVIPQPIRVTDVRALGQALRERAPRFVRPRLLAENVHVLEVGEVGAVHYEPGEQSLQAEVRDPLGHPFALSLEYRAEAPGALEALAEALAGRPGRLRYLSGAVACSPEGVRITPIAVVCEGAQPISLDLQAPRSLGALGSAPVASEASPLDALLLAAEGLLAEAAQRGLRRGGPGWIQRVTSVEEEARALGMGQLAEALRRLASAVGRSADSGESRPACSAWADAAIRVAVALEQSES